MKKSSMERVTAKRWEVPRVALLASMVLGYKKLSIVEQGKGRAILGPNPITPVEDLNVKVFGKGRWNNHM